MTDEQANPITPQPHPDAPETPTGSADAPNQKTYTESEVNAMMATRLAKQERALKAQLAEEAQRLAERAKLDEVERVKAEKADAEKRAADAEARATRAERKAALTGKVADATAALKLLDETKHLGEDGTVNVDALLADYPFLKPPTPSATGGAVPAPGQTRGTSEPKSLADAVNQHYR